MMLKMRVDDVLVEVPTPLPFYGAAEALIRDFYPGTIFGDYHGEMTFAHNVIWVEETETGKASERPQKISKVFAPESDSFRGSLACGPEPTMAL